MIEWYENRAEGVEQGFAIDAPEADGTGALRLELESAG